MSIFFFFSPFMPLLVSKKKNRNKLFDQKTEIEDNFGLFIGYGSFDFFLSLSVSALTLKRQLYLYFINLEYLYDSYYYLPKT